jgi:hypothetical protein
MIVALIVSGAAVICPWTLEGQQKRVSPHEKIYTRVNKKLVSISYGRPFSKDPKKGETRQVWGKLVPWDKAWRAGSDEATTLITEAPVAIGGTTVPAGAYSLYLVPSEKGATKLAVSKTIGKWGIPVDEGNDLARIDMKKDTLDKDVDQFTMMFDKGGVLKMSWEKTQFSVEFTAPK